MKKLIALALLVLVATATWTYEPKSDEQLADWWEGLTREQRLAELQKLDQAENADPEVQIPTYDVIVTDNLVYLRPRSPLTFTAGPFSWDVILPEQQAAYEPVKHNRIADILATAGVVAALSAPLWLWVAGKIP